MIRFAEQDERIVITKDADFVHSHVLHGRPSKLLLISTGNLTNTALESIFAPQMTVLAALFETHSFIELSRTTLVVHK